MAHETPIWKKPDLKYGTYIMSGREVRRLADEEILASMVDHKFHFIVKLPKRESHSGFRYLHIAPEAALRQGKWAFILTDEGRKFMLTHIEILPGELRGYDSRTLKLRSVSTETIAVALPVFAIFDECCYE